MRLPVIWRRAMLLSATLLVVGASPAIERAKADVAGAGADETIAQAFGPLAQSVTYTGAFTNPADVDYLAFRVATAGETLQFTVSNTLQSCNSPDDDACPLYATLMDQTNQQVGGDTSDAGTVATVADTETFNWTFAQAGTYYVLMESNGNLPNGQPTYAVRIDPIGGGGSGSGSGSGSGGSGSGSGTPGTGNTGSTSTGQPAIVKSVAVNRHQRGTSVTVTVTLVRRAARIRAMLFTPRHGKPHTLLAVVKRTRTRAGRYRLSLRLPPAYRTMLRRRHHLSLLVEVTVWPITGRKLNYSRRVTLSG